jgi:hypothetical protein
MQKETDWVLKLIRKAMLKESVADSQDFFSAAPINWERVKEMISYHELYPYLHTALRDSSIAIPEEIASLLENSYYSAIARNLKIFQEYLRIHADFRQEGIGVVPIKGVAILADLYSTVPARAMVDIDLLVKETDYQQAATVLEGMGYIKELEGLEEKYWRQKQCHVEFRLKKEGRTLSYVDLHWALDFKRGKRIILPELWQRIRSTAVEGRMIEILSPEDAFFSLVLHQRRFGKTLNFKYAIDASLILKKYANDFDWDYLIRQAKDGRLVSAAFFLLYQARYFLGIQLPEFVWEEIKPAYLKKRLIKRFIAKDTFILSQNIRGQYLKTHFLLYDSILEPFGYILKIPQEQFAKFYNLKPYLPKTDFLYRARLFYMPYKLLSSLVG